MAAQLATVKAFISSHETLDPPSPGKWSILRSSKLPADFSALLGSFTDDSLPVSSPERTAVIRILLDWLAVWDVHFWPSGTKMNVMSFVPYRDQLSQLDSVRWSLLTLMRQIFVYAGVALAQTGLDNSLAEKHLRDGLVHLSKAGLLNILWALGALERVLRAQHKDAEALVMCVPPLNVIQSVG
ncbi:hypothetical protein RQP46_002443 [Phenoliferia psychrophenolica]